MKISMEDSMIEGWIQTKSWSIRKSRSKKYCILYAVSSGNPWLSYYENDNPDQHKEPHKKVILQNVKSIDKMVKSSSKEFMITICIKGSKNLTLYFENEMTLDQWYNALKRVVTIIQSEGSSATMSEYENAPEELTANRLYQPSANDKVFIVSVEPTDASNRNDLVPDKKYRLHVNAVTLMLEDTEKGEIVAKWILEYIRKYGVNKTGSFTLEAGSRCETGTGHFTFICSDANLIRQNIDILSSQKHRENLMRPQQALEKREVDSNEPETNVNMLMRKHSKPKVEKKPSNTLPSRSSVVDSSFQKELSNKISHLDVNDSEMGENRSSSTKKKHFENKKEHVEDRINVGKKEPKQPKKEEKEKTGKKDEKPGKLSVKEEKPKNKKKLFFSFGKKDGESCTKFYDPPSEALYDEVTPEAQASNRNNWAPTTSEKVLSSPTKGKSQQAVYWEVGKQHDADAWKTQGLPNEHHMELYDNIKKAAEENNGRVFQQKEYDDQLYDHLESFPGAKVKDSIPSENIYGIASGKAVKLKDFHQESEMYSEVANQNIEDESEYDDATSVQQRCLKASAHSQWDTYEDVDIKTS